MTKEDRILKHLLYLFKGIIQNLNEDNDFDYPSEPVTSHTNWNYIPQNSAEAVYSLNGSNSPSINDHNLDNNSGDGVVIDFTAPVGGDTQIFLNSHVMAVREVGNPAGWSYLNLQDNQELYINDDVADIVNNVFDKMATPDCDYMNLKTDQKVKGQKDFRALPLFRGEPLVYQGEFRRALNHIKDNFHSNKHDLRELNHVEHEFYDLQNNLDDLSDDVGENYVSEDQLRDYVPYNQLEYYVSKSTLHHYVRQSDLVTILLHRHMMVTPDMAGFVANSDLDNMKHAVKVDLKKLGNVQHQEAHNLLVRQNEMSTSLDSLKNATAKLSKAINAPKAIPKTSGTDNDTLSNSLKAMKQTIKQIENQSSSHNAQLNTLSSELNDHTSALADNIKKMKSTIHKINIRAVDHNQPAVNTSVSSNLQTQLNNLSNQVKANASAVKNKFNRIKTVTHNINERAADHDNNSAQSSLQAQLNNLSSQVSTHVADMDKMKQAIHKMNVRAKDHHYGDNNLASSSLQTQLNNLSSEVSDQTNAVKAEFAKINQTIHRMNTRAQHHHYGANTGGENPDLTGLINHTNQLQNDVTNIHTHNTQVDNRLNTISERLSNIISQLE